MSGSVTRRDRSPEEMRALLSDPNLPISARNEFERELGLPETSAAEAPAHPVGTAIVGPHFAAPFPLPRVWAGEREVSYTEFESIHQFHDGTASLVWGGPGPLTPTRILTGRGHEVPTLANAVFPAGGTLVIPLGRVLRVQADGRLIRNGKVIRDGAATPAEQEEDRRIEKALITNAVNVIRGMVMEKAPLLEILQAVMRLGYHRTSAENIVAGELEGLGYSGGYPA